MKSFNEIVENNIVDGDFDIPAIITEAIQEMGSLPQLTMDQSFAIIDAHYAYAIQYLGNIVLGVADAIGALPDGPEAAAEDLALSLELDKVRRLYNMKAEMAKRKIVVPGQ